MAASKIKSKAHLAQPVLTQLTEVSVGEMRQPRRRRCAEVADPAAVILE
jgi:hypothetical protein